MTINTDILDPNQDRVTLLKMAEAYAVDGNSNAPYQLLRTANALAKLATYQNDINPFPQLQPDHPNYVDIEITTTNAKPAIPPNLKDDNTSQNNKPQLGQITTLPDTTGKPSPKVFTWVIRDDQLNLHCNFTTTTQYIPVTFYNRVLNHLSTLYQAQPKDLKFSMSQIIKEFNAEAHLYNQTRHRVEAMVHYLIGEGAISRNTTHTAKRFTIVDDPSLYLRDETPPATQTLPDPDIAPVPPDHAPAPTTQAPATTPAHPVAPPTKPTNRLMSTLRGFIRRG